MSAYPSAPPDRIEAAALRRLLALPRGAMQLLAGEPVELDGQRLETEIQLLLRVMAADPRPAMETLPPDGARESIRHAAGSVAGAPIALARITETTVQGAEGALPARLYVPREALAEPAPLLLYFHGGGWVVGDLDSHDATCRLLARTAGVRVLAVDYRLGPEHRFPAAPDDALAALRHVHAHAGDYGADPARIGVGGDSAGGNLSAATALQAARDGGPAPAFQLLIYPVTDNVAPQRAATETTSYRLFADGFFLTAEQMRWYRGHYFGTAEAELATDERASPLLAADLSGVAPAHVVTAGFDPLRDEGEAYAARLREAGVPVTLRRHPGLIHGFVNMVGPGRVSREAVIEMGGVLRAGLSA
ncbi:MAG: alpha/beta hydrolase [Solirubrobacteraceae bacterium]|jgi:acetyl esterase|nr:alpha/beta hydrolase [Solirubrobacteraceae bacterium]MCU0314296.1 alpha/beta hydrolase [Solirubrobacteraceae bacterium]